MAQEGLFQAKVISDGRITISGPVRERLGVEEGDFVEVMLRKVGVDE